MKVFKLIVYILLSAAFFVLIFYMFGYILHKALDIEPHKVYSVMVWTYLLTPTIEESHTDLVSKKLREWAKK